MTKSKIVSASIATIGTIALLAIGTFWRFDIRHSAPFGFSKTIDFDRLIAVSGGYVAPNYNGFNRVDLDLRAYDAGAVYDLTVHIRPAEPGALDIRTIAADLPSTRIFNSKSTWTNPYITIRFPPIADSAGKNYYVWVEPGIRNRDQVVALWSIKSYSRARAWTVLAAFVRDVPGGNLKLIVKYALVLGLAAFAGVIGWLLLAINSVTDDPNASRNRWRRSDTDGIQ